MYAALAELLELLGRDIHPDQRVHQRAVRLGDAQVQVGSGGITSRPDLADLLAGLDLVALVHGHRTHVAVQDQVAVGGLDGDRLAGGSLPFGCDHLAVLDGIDGGALGGAQVDPAVDTAGVDGTDHPVQVTHLVLSQGHDLPVGGPSARVGGLDRGGRGLPRLGARDVIQGRPERRLGDHGLLGGHVSGLGSRGARHPDGGKNQPTPDGERRGAGETGGHHESLLSNSDA